jgi:hypothetical protein
VFLSLRALGPLAIIALASTTVFGQDPKPETKQTCVTILVILASEKSDKVDPRVKCIADEIRKRNPQLKGFRLGSMSKQSVAVDQIATFPVGEGQTAQVVVKKASCPKGWVELAVIAPSQGEIVYSTVCGKFLPIITRCQTRKQERLILAVRVQPCKMK